MSGAGRPLATAELVPLLNELGRRVQARGFHARLYIFGGAAMALAHGARQSTDDIDAAMEPRDIVLEESSAMAKEHGLSADWLNSNGDGFRPQQYEDVDAQELNFGGVTVSLASPRFLLAMKLTAGRARDVSDITFLIQEVGIASATEITQLVRDLYGDDSVPSIDFEDMDLFAAEMLRATRKRYPGFPPAPQLSAEPADSPSMRGPIWVAPHQRDGANVKGHTRKRR